MHLRFLQFPGIDKLLESSNLTLDDIDIIVLHQANRRIIETVAKNKGISRKKIAMNIASYGNTSSANILILPDAYYKENHKTQRILIVGFGGGFTWGGTILNLGEKK